MSRSPAAEQDWRVSRALLQQIADNEHVEISITHKKGYAVIATAPPGWRIGVDLERVRVREVERLAEWVCSPAERAELSAQGPDAKLQHFYRLWTYKEAALKARGQTFPADMPTNTLHVDAAGHYWMAHEQMMRGWDARCAEWVGEWVIGVTWQSPTPGAAEPLWRIVGDPPDGELRHVPLGRNETGAGRISHPAPASS